MAGGPRAVLSTLQSDAFLAEKGFVAGCLSGRGGGYFNKDDDINKEDDDNDHNNNDENYNDDENHNNSGDDEDNMDKGNLVSLHNNQP